MATPEIQSEDSIGVDPLPPGQVWGISPGGQDENPGLYRLEVNVNPGSGVKVLNKPCPAPFQESIKFAEQNLLARAKELVGDRDPRPVGRKESSGFPADTAGGASDDGDLALEVLFGHVPP